MTDCVIAFLVGMVLGGVIGFMIMALCVMCGRTDRENEKAD